MSKQYSWFPALSDGKFQASFQPVNPAKPLSQTPGAYDELFGHREASGLLDSDNQLESAQNPAFETLAINTENPAYQSATANDSSSLAASEDEDSPKVKPTLFGNKKAAKQPKQYEATSSFETTNETIRQLTAGDCRPWRRLGAHIIDGILMSLASSVVMGIAAAGMMPMLMASMASPDLMSGLTQALGLYAGLMGLSFALIVGLECFCLTRFQGTPGKMLLGLKVLSSQASQISMKGALGRTTMKYLLFVVSGFLPLLGPLALYVVSYMQYKKGHSLLWDKMSHHQVYYYPKA